ncbi:hypothetical protein LPJ59_004139 [Coemansia sp. RSA 2399]|nr:hypothetical protein LPJ59_004139 [Coemansia sp. RSA 2399]
MYTNTLPDLVVLSILGEFCKDNEAPCDALRSVDRWKNRLVLLAVCRKWRTLALPIVHRNSFITCSSVKTAIGYAVPDAGEETQDCVAVKSNLDIIAKNSEDPCFPRHLVVHLACPDTPANTLIALIEHMRSNALLLERVHHVEMAFFLEPYGRLIWRAVPVGVAKARLLGKELVDLLPNVTQFTWLPPHNNEIPQAFANEALKRYSQQLTKLVLVDKALADVPCLSKQLKELMIAFIPKRQKHIPRICPESLETLHLDEIDGRFPWSSFTETPDSRILDFANLQRATLGCAITDTEDENGDDAWDAPAESFQYKVTAPNIKYMRIQLCPYLLSFVSSIHDLDTIGELEIETRDSSIKLTEFRLDLARQMFADYAKASSDSSEIIDQYRYLNDILGTPGLAKACKANVGLFVEFIDIDIERVEWTYLTSLKINCSMSYLDLQRLVARLPNLSELSVSNVMVKPEDST